MALSRNFLSALGIEGDKIEEIVKANYESLNGIMEERDKAKEALEALKKETAGYKEEAKKTEALQKELDELKNAADGGENAWKVKYEAVAEERDNIKAEFDKFKSETSAKETKAAKERAYRGLLKESGVSEKWIERALKLADLENVELDNEGKIKDSDQHKQAIQAEWSDCIPKESEKGADTAKPPANTGGSGKTKEEIMAIKDRSERQKAIAENPKLFGIE